MSIGRSLVLGCIASFKECWAFRRTIAGFLGLSIRTVQRAITQGKALGLMGANRAGKNEIPPGRTLPLPCGWSRRWIVGWGLAVEAAKKAVERCRLKRLAKQALKSSAHPDAKQRPERRAMRHYTAAEIDAELARLERPP